MAYYRQVGHDQVAAKSNIIPRKPIPSIEVVEGSNFNTPFRLGGQRGGKNPIEIGDSRTTQPVRPSASLQAGSWIFELLNLFIAFAAVASIIAVLAHFDDQPLPKWPYGITMNAPIALLVTIATAALAVPLSNGLSQLKWIHFKTSQAPLTDIELFDEASRGTWGAAKLLAKGRGGIFGSFGAVIAIAALATGPFAQQIVTYQQHATQTGAAAYIYKAWNYDGWLYGRTLADFVAELPMKAAVYNGLFAEDTAPITMPFSCPTGNCTFSTYDTLAFCSKCKDMTTLMTRYCVNGTPTHGNDSTCGWQLPKVAYLNSSSDVFSLTPEFPSSNGSLPQSAIVKLTFMGTENPETGAGVLNPWAMSCILEACVQTIQSVVVEGNLTETVTKTLRNSTVMNTTKLLADPNGDVDFAANFTTTEGETYFISAYALVALRNWFGTLFTKGSSSYYSPNTTTTLMETAVLANYSIGSGNWSSEGLRIFDTDVIQAFYWNYYSYDMGLNVAMDELAQSMTIMIRSYWLIPGYGNNNTCFMDTCMQGSAQSVEAFVHVRWEFITLPVFVVVLTAVFLVGPVLESRWSQVSLFKSSALAMVFHGLDPEAWSSFARSGTLEEKKKTLARDVPVVLADYGDHRNLLPSNPR